MLENGINALLTLLGMDTATTLGSAVTFFFYDSIKILLLLYLINIVMGVLNSYFPIERLRRYLTTHRLWGLQYVLASLFGAITPFCSCSSIPLFIGLVRGGIPMGVTLTFLISSPLINEVAVAMFLGSLGLRATLVYVASGLVLGIIGGGILSFFRLERFLSPWVQEMMRQDLAAAEDGELQKESFRQRLPRIMSEAHDILRRILPYVLGGIAVGAAMHGYVPEAFFAEYLAAGRFYTVPLAVLMAVPMYANAAGVVPIIQVLVSKGVPLGTALTFMMAVVGLSLPEAAMLKKVMSWRLIGIFFSSVTLIIILAGYLFNLIL